MTVRLFSANWVFELELVVSRFDGKKSKALETQSEASDHFSDS